MTTDERLDRLERAITELDYGVDWTRFRTGGRGRAALNEIRAEIDAVRESDERALRTAALESELAALKGAA